jgi:hypothetical protein
LEDNRKTQIHVGKKIHSETPNPFRELHFQPLVENPIGNQRNHQAPNDAYQPSLGFNESKEKEKQQEGAQYISQFFQNEGIA